MLVRRIWTIPASVIEKKDEEKRAVRLGLGGALENSTAKGRRLGRRLGWASFWSMATVVLFSWIRWGLLELGLDFSNGIPGLDVTLMFVSATMVVVSHLLLFVCDHLTGGDAGPSAWALAIFWLGLLVLPFFLEIMGMFL